MKVSILTSCYNREATIRGCIESVFGQDYPDIEYIVVDGASSDKSLDIIKEEEQRTNDKDFILSHPKFTMKIISEPDKGMYEAINKGLRAATGDIIGLVHSDDFLYDHDTVSKIVYRFRLLGCDLVYGNGIFVDTENTDRIVRNWISGRYTRRKVYCGWLPLHPTVYITRKWLDKCGMYDESYKIAADSDWLVRSLYDMSPKVSYMKEYIVRMRMGGMSTDPEKAKKKWSEDLRMYRSHGLPPKFALAGKIMSKIPQFIEAKFK